MLGPTLALLKEIMESKGFPKLVDFVKYSGGLILATIVIIKLFSMLDILPVKLDTIITKLDQCGITGRVAYKK